MIATHAGDVAHAGHDLLLRLAGRMPDGLLWRLRDWLGAGDTTALAMTLPRALLRHRIGLTDAERELLLVAVGGSEGAHRLVDAVLPLTRPDEPPVTFRPGPTGPDPAALTLLAVVRGHPGCAELRQTVRVDGRLEQRVVLVRGGERPWALTATLQRLLRAAGERTPCVEVLAAPDDDPPYHQAALRGSALMWRTSGADAPAWA